MAKASPLKIFVRNNGLAIFMLGLFVIFLICLSVTGYYHANDELHQHGQAAQTYGDYIASGAFIEAIFENWESEFLQMAALVIATIFLRQKGAADSKKIRGHEDVDTSSRHSIIRGVYANSLSLALIALFLVSFALHALGGVSEYNQENALHGQSAIGAWEYVRTSQFWFESFQNWQSEFLSVGVLLVLSVYLRQQGSPESKPVGASNSKTGE